MRTAYGDTFAQRGGRYERSMARSPDVRLEEFGAMLRRLRPLAGERVLDVPSGGAYLRPLLPAKVRYVAVDEADQFHQACRGRLRPGDRALRAPAHQLPVASSSCHAVCSVAGRHPQHDRLPIYREWYRVLKPGGRVVRADVAEGSAVGAFLNGFVDRYNSQGHDGLFLSDADGAALAAAGFRDIHREDVHYHWRFRDAAHVREFCAGLFGLDRVGASGALVRTLVADLGLCVATDGSGWLLPWTLRYFAGRRPGSGAAA